MPKPVDLPASTLPLLRRLLLLGVVWACTWTSATSLATAQALWTAQVRVGKPPRATRLRVTRGEEGLLLQVGGKAVPLPLQDFVKGTTRTVELAGGAQVAIVTLQGRQRRAAALLTQRRGATWLGRLDPHGDPGEERHAVVQVADRTGDGVEDVIVGRYEAGSGLCGQERTILDPRAVDPSTLRLRPVLLDRLEPADEDAVVDVEAVPRESVSSSGSRALPPDPAPVVPLLRYTAASSQAGTPAELSVTPPGMLADGDASSFWMEGRGRSGRGEFVTATWRGTQWPIRALSIVPVPEDAGVPTAVPTALWLVGDTGPRLHVTFSERPKPGQRYWITPPEPLGWRCLALVLDEAAPPDDHPDAFVAIAELQAYSELDFGDGPARLVKQLASDGREGTRAVHWLRAMGSDAVPHVRDAWSSLSSRGRRRAVQVLSASAAAHEGAREALAQAARDTNAEVRQDALAALADAMPDATPQLVTLLGAPDATGEQAALVLSRRAPGRAVAPLLKAIAQKNGSERPHLRRALRSAAGASEPDAERLDAWTKAASPAALAAAALALAPEWPEPARRMLEKARSAAEQFPTLWRLVQAASQLPPQEPTLNAWLAEIALEDPRWMLREAALNALRARDVEAAHGIAAELTMDSYPRVRASALRALPDTRQADRHLERHVRRDRWPLVRVAAVETLAAHRADVTRLRRSLEDPSREVRAATIRALKARADRKAWPAIAERMRNENEWPAVVSEGVAFAKALCLAEAAPTLQALIERALQPQPWAPDVDVAAEALDALATVAPDRADKALKVSAQPSSPPALQRTAEEAAERATACTPHE